MKHSFFIVRSMILLLLWSSFSQASAQNFRTDLPSDQFKAEGWAKEFLVRQETGLTGHPEESGFPFNTGLWTEDMDVKQDEFQYYRSPWWPFEHTGYYLDGALRCAYAINSTSLMERVDTNIQYVLDHADADGRLHAGTIGVNEEWWPMVVFMRLLFEKYDATKDPKLLNALERHYQSVYIKRGDFEVPTGSGFYVRATLHVEHLCELYGITKNKDYLNAAEKLYAIFQDDSKPGTVRYQFSAKGMAEGQESTGHGVTYHEFLKLPAVLYKYTGKELYKKAVYNAVKQLEDNHELVDGLASCSEPFAGKGSEKAHEMCNTVEFNWSLGYALLATGDAYFADKMEKSLYNSGFSCVTNDFKAHQYFSMPNLLISTNMSSSVDDHHPWGLGSKGRMSYKPGHDTQCCSGNVHRMFPTFLSRACMLLDNRVDIVFYLPSTINVAMKKGAFSFTQKTNYPFNHDVEIVINSAPSSKVDLGLRIPSWADSYTIKMNGSNFLEGTDTSVFKTISKKFKVGDKVAISFNTTPKIDTQSTGGVAINYGPLVFSHPIEYKEKQVTKDFAGKCSPEFPAYEFTPMDEHHWAVALSKNITSDDIEIIKTGNTGYAWDYNNAPIALRVKAKTVTNWELDRWLSTSAFPENIETDKDISLDLSPMGNTLLRITEFPKADFESSSL